MIGDAEGSEKVRVEASRVRGAVVDFVVLARLFRDRPHMESDLPEDATIVRVTTDEFRRPDSVVIWFHSATWPETPRHSMRVPDLEIMMREVHPVGVRDDLA